MKKYVVCFGFCCTFVLATSSCNQLVSDNNSCLDNPVGQVSFLLVGCRMVSLPPNRAFLFVKQRHYHAHTSTPPSTAPITERLTLTFAAIPPAAFFHTLFLNRLAPGKG